MRGNCKLFEFRPFNYASSCIVGVPALSTPDTLNVVECNDYAMFMNTITNKYHKRRLLVKISIINRSLIWRLKSDIYV